MKTFKILILLISLSIFFFYACEKIEAPFKTGGGVSERGKSGDTVKNVLVEDYTGHGCVNCPAAAETAHDLQGVYGERLVVIAVHAGHWATPDIFGPEFSTDFRCETGNTWNTFFAVSTAGNPNGLVDRYAESGGNYIVAPLNWGPKVENRLNEDFLAKITIENTFNVGTNMLNSNIVTEFQTNLPGNYSLLVCVTQDSIIAAQKDERVDENHGTVEDYVHMYALRGSMNGDWGENVTAGEDVVSGKAYEKNYSIKFENDWVSEDCWVVAFVYDESNKTLIQVDEEKVTN